MAPDVAKFHFRLVLLGSNRTGKTSILNRFLFKRFEPKYKPTVEDLFSKEFDLGSIEIRVDFLDTSGSMQFPAMRRLSISTGDAFLIVYSVDDESSFEAVKMSIEELQSIREDYQMDAGQYQDLPIVFAGNKCDIPKSERKLQKELVSNYVYYGLPRLRTKVIECSCKENINIDAIFKSYLSLARVIPSSAAGVNLDRKRLATQVKSLQHDSNPNSPSSRGAYRTSNKSGNCDHEDGNQRSSSFKVGLRKSCDASIVTCMRNMAIATNGSKDTLATMREAGSSPSDSQSVARTQELEKISIKDALQRSNEWTVDQRAKPRSRSLIWRPNRKPSSRNGRNLNADCRVN